jgi:single-strand selective monofunctional uracil DNA glycosylase
MPRKSDIPIVALAAQLRDAVDQLEFGPPVSCTYNPLNYAWDPHRTYLERYGQGRKRIVFMGMNPGPYGMTQTGVPFGEVAAVRDWLKISGTVERPRCEHPKRPITGYACERSEVSGRRLWGLFAARFGTPEVFFRDHFVLNYCPLVWMTETGANLTPDKLPTREQQAVNQVCEQSLRAALELLRPEVAVGIGGFAVQRLTAVSRPGDPWHIKQILHPSPASPAANRDWAGAATRALVEAGIWSG